MDPAHAQQLLCHGTDASLALDADGRIVWANVACEAVFGLSPREFEGQAFVRWIVAGPQLDALLGRVVQTGPARPEAVILRRRDGRAFEAALTLVHTDGLHWLLIRDLEREAEREAGSESRANQILRALSDAAFEAVFMHANGVFRYANRAAEIYSGVGPGELIGRSLLDFIAPQSREMALAKVAAGDNRPYEAYGVRSSGEIYPVEVHPRTVPVELDGEQLRVVAMRDLSDRRALEQRVRESQKLEAMGRLASGLAHDFNNFLAVIVTACDLAAATLDEDHPASEDLAEIGRAADQASALVRRLLAFGRRSQLEPQTIDLRALLERMRPLLLRALGSAHQLSYALGELPATVHVDPQQIEQVILNLVVNARDALGDHGHVWLELGMLDDGHPTLGVEPCIELRVRDDGSGMDAATQAKIFEPFFTTKGPERGSGLGLASVFGIIEQSGGAIWVESERGVGSCFHVALPKVHAAQG